MLTFIGLNRLSGLMPKRKFTPQELRSMDPLHDGDTWLVERFLPKNELGTLFAESGTGKTFLLLDAFASCLTGAKCMGRLDTTPISNAVWINQDMGEASWNERLRQIYTAKDEKGEHAGTPVAYHHEDIYLDTGDGRKQFKEIMEEDEPDLVVIDSLAKHLDSNDPSDIESVSAMMDSVRSGMEINNCTVVFIAHTNREGDYYGSQANEADVDFTWLAEKRGGSGGGGPDNVVVRKRKSRNVQPMTGFEFRINSETLESDWVRPLQDQFSVKERMDVLAALDFAHSIEQDPDEEHIKVASFIRKMADQMGKFRARKTFDTLARQEGLLRLRPERGERGAHIYEITEKGREWYEGEMQHAKDQLQQRFTVEEDDSMDEMDLVDAVDDVTDDPTPETPHPDPEPDLDELHVEDQWVEPECSTCGMVGHRASNCTVTDDSGSDGPDMDDVFGPTP